MIDLAQLNFHHLFYFWRVARSGHLTRVAQELHTSQSALSTQIRQLEDRLGEPLFTREGRRLLLTDTGQLVLAYAENIFGLGQEMLGRLQGQSEGVVRLRVGSVSTLSRNYQENWIRPLLQDPSVVLVLESGVLEGLLERLLRHQLDVVLANEPVAAGPDRPLHSRFLGSQTISLVGPAEQWKGRSLMAIGLQDPVLGEPVMRRLQGLIRGCPEPLLLPEAGHFVQEQGRAIAEASVRHFKT